jgi:hypothetical protein
MLPRKAPKGAGELVLYLDFDGVLHHEECYWDRRGPYIKARSLGLKPPYSVFQHVELLEHLLEPYPEIEIVLSTSWVRTYGCHGTAKRLPSESLRRRVIGATFHSKMNESEFCAAPRGMQVWGDVVIRKPRDWLAVDDDYLHWPKWTLDKYVRTHMRDGISDPLVRQELENKLALLGASGKSGGNPGLIGEI